MIYLELFFCFFLIGLFTIGGGLAALPLLQQTAVDGGWITQAEFYDMLAISQSTPGPIGINMATYIGFDHASILGAMTATAGMVTPSIIIIMLIAHFMKNFDKTPIVKRAMHALRASAVGLIATAAYFVLAASLFHVNGGDTRFNVPAVLLFVVLGLAYVKFKGHPIFYILAGGVAGVFLWG